jgi:hypothetical protein
MDIENHTETVLTGSKYGTIGNHSTIHIEGLQSVTIGHVEDHCNISGDCKTLTIGSMADHVKICITGVVQHGATGDHCEITENATQSDVDVWRAANDRPGNPGN